MYLNEHFNRLYREAVLDAYLFFDLDQVRQLTEEWIDETTIAGRMRGFKT